MIEIHQTQVFGRWLRTIRDTQAGQRIADRIQRLALGNFGDVGSVGGGVSELRIHDGSGYRVYFARRGQSVVVLLADGDKDSQSRDIKTAQD